MSDPLPGPQGRSWWELEFITNEGAWWVLDLDLEPPRVYFQTPSGREAGQTLTIPYTLTEPAITQASLFFPDGSEHDLTVGWRTLTYDLPSDAVDGTYTVKVWTLDSVGNAGVWETAYEIGGPSVEEPFEYVLPGYVEGYREVVPEPPVQPDVGGATVPLTGAGPLVGAPYELVVPGTVEGTREVEFVLSGAVRGVEPPVVEFAVPGSVVGSRTVEFVLGGTRLPSPRMARLAREDDEMMLML